MKFSIESLYRWYRNTIRNPKYRWWIIGASLVYLLSPVDISPDVFPIVGWIDDGVIATLLVTEVSSMFLDKLKAGKRTAASQPSEATTASGSTDDTVDVDAVFVK